MPLLLMISGECLHTLAQPITADFRTRGLESFNPVTKRISKRGSVLKVLQLLQLQIQALQVTECGYKNSSSKFILAKPLK